MLYLSFIIFMACIARMAGGGLWAERLPHPVPEIIFGLCFGVANYLAFENVWLALAVWVWCYAWMETGHGTVLSWGLNPDDATGARRQTLTPVVEFICRKLGVPFGSVNYCRIFMAVKGFLIGLPVGGIVLAVLWPLAYETGERLRKHEVSEFTSGAFAAMAILLFNFIIM